MQNMHIQILCFWYILRTEKDIRLTILGDDACEIFVYNVIRHFSQPNDFVINRKKRNLSFFKSPSVFNDWTLISSKRLKAAAD